MSSTDSSRPESDASPVPVEPRENADNTIDQLDSAPLPPADLTTLITMFATQALVALGELPHPSTGKTSVHLNLARHFVDLLGVVEVKTRGNLEAGEKRLLDAQIHQLRLIFLDRRNRKPMEA